MKNSILWDVAPCRSCVNRYFGGMYRLHGTFFESVEKSEYFELEQPIKITIQNK
jgi:hypothetical protein